MKRILLVLIVVAALALPTVASVSAETLAPITFESPTHTLGNVNGQDGWSKTGPFDVEVANNIGDTCSWGTQSLRISDAVTSGSFGDQTFAKPLVNAVGEATATAGAFDVGVRQSHFEMQFEIRSTQVDQQPGMHVSVSPDRGDGSRMSYLRFEDGVAGIDVYFDDVQQPGPCTPGGCANFVETQVAVGLSRAAFHTIRLTMDTLDGPGNDVVKLYIDGALVHSGTSWEDYYRYDPEASADQSPRIVRTVLFRVSGANTPANLGKGFLFDNINLKSSPSPSIELSTATPTFCNGPVDVTIDLKNVVDLYGYQFEVGYDAAKVNATGAFVTSWFNGSSVAPWNAACGAGLCKFSETLTGSAAVTGSGPVAKITLTGLASGTSNLVVKNVLLSDRDGNPTPVAAPAPLAIKVQCKATVSGKVNLQGRAKPVTDGTVTLAGPFGSYSGAFLGADGTWKIENVEYDFPAGSSYTVNAAHLLYLANEKVQAVAGDVTMATTKLWGGDANNDAIVDVSDLSCIGGHFGSVSDCGDAPGGDSSDINADGTTNVQDLSIAGGNYYKTTPQSW